MRGSRAPSVRDGTGLDRAAVGAAIGGRRVDAVGEERAAAAAAAGRKDAAAGSCSYSPLAAGCSSEDVTASWRALHVRREKEIRKMREMTPGKAVSRSNKSWELNQCMHVLRTSVEGTISRSVKAVA
jgi:hypothetical protein